jgi:lysophospholipase L1-like esterase
MKNVFLLIAMIVFTSTLAAQKLQWDSTYRPGIYAMKVGQFRSFPNSSKDIIFLGNSITDFADWNELLQLNEARNRGISGDITFGVLERLDEITEGKPSKVFILIGINDISRNIPDSVIADNYKKIIQRIKKGSPKTKIYFNTVLPVNNTFPNRDHFNKDDHILYVNDQLKKLGTAEKITIIDIHPHFLDAEKRLDKKYTYDGLHLTIEGYQKWVSILKPFLK